MGGSTQNERPTYHRYVPSADSGSEGTFFVSLDLERFRELEERNLQTLPGDANVDLQSEGSMENADPMVAYPAVSLVVAILGMSFGLIPYGFSSDIATGIAGDGVGAGTAAPNGSEGATETEETPVRVDAMTLVENAFVFDGSFDTAAIGEASDGFEKANERDGFVVYEGVESDSFVDTTGLGFAVSDDTLVALLDSDEATDPPGERIDHLLDVATGATDRMSADADADWTLRRAGHGLVSIGGWGVDPDNASAGPKQVSDELEIKSVLDSADGLVSSLALESDQFRADVAAVYPEGETPDREKIEGELGTSAAEREIEVDGTRVAVTARWPVETATPTDTP